MKHTLITSGTLMLMGLTVTLLAQPRGAPPASQPCAPRMEEDRIIDCREIGLRAAKDYLEEDGWLIKDIHYNHRDHHCYLSLSAIPDLKGKNLGLAVPTDVLRDLDENRNLAVCHKGTTDGKTTYASCMDGDQYKLISRERYEELRREYLERR
jgi:hypothetical protein